MTDVNTLVDAVTKKTVHDVDKKYEFTKLINSNPSPNLMSFFFKTTTTILLSM